jgi:cell division protein FtsQ
VRVTGLTTSDAEQVRSVLTTRAKSMTTLHVDMESLERAVSAYPVVRSLEVSRDFPNGLRIRVLEHHPVAIAVSGDTRVAVSGDGTILRGLPVQGRLPVVEVEGSLAGERLRGRPGLRAAAVAGLAPEVLRGRIEEIEHTREDGLVASLREGPELIFGDASRLRAKWAAAARVLADAKARGASYVDLRIPGRPAAGGLPALTLNPVAPAGTTLESLPAADPAAADPGAATDPAAPSGDPAAVDPLVPPANAGDPAASAPAETTPAPAPPAPSGTSEGGATAPAGP